MVVAELRSIAESAAFPPSSKAESELFPRSYSAKSYRAFAKRSSQPGLVRPCAQPGRTLRIRKNPAEGAVRGNFYCLNNPVVPGSRAEALREDELHAFPT
jgi:hypothetical protein